MRKILLVPSFVTLAAVMLATSSAFGVGFLLHPQPAAGGLSPIRPMVILSQADQLKEVGSIVVGDSITERAYLPRLCGQSVLNAGVGGAKADQVVGLLRDLLRRMDTNRVLIAIGVNDAGRSYPTSVDSFRTTYRALISAAAATGAEVTVATIAPVGNGFAFGDNVFDPALIKRFNVEIRKIAMELHANVAEIDQDLAGEDGFLPHDFTMDGVHLTRTGYQPWKRTLEKSACIQ